jgi:DNA-binding transcriptional ArsR family regulator
LVTSLVFLFNLEVFIMSKSKSRAKANVPAEVIVRAAWEAFQAGTGIQGVADATGLSAGSVSTRLSVLRQKHKVKLPTFPRGGGGGRRLDLDSLNAIADEFAS